VGVVARPAIIVAAVAILLALNAREFNAGPSDDLPALSSPRPEAPSLATGLHGGALIGCSSSPFCFMSAPC
jgi:hypothetical protein